MPRNFPSFVCYPKNRENFQNISQTQKINALNSNQQQETELPGDVDIQYTQDMPEYNPEYETELPGDVDIQYTQDMPEYNPEYETEFTGDVDIVERQELERQQMTVTMPPMIQTRPPVMQIITMPPMTQTMPVIIDSKPVRATTMTPMSMIQTAPPMSMIQTRPPTSMLSTTGPSIIRSDPTIVSKATRSPTTMSVTQPMVKTLPLGITVQGPTHSDRVGGSQVCVDDTCFNTDDFKNILKNIIVLGKTLGKKYN